MFYRFALITVAVLVTACSDPKAANEKNFKVAVQKDLDAVYPKCYLKNNFPATVHDYEFLGTKASFKALVSAGMLSEKEESHEIEVGFRGRKQIVVQPTFYLTVEGNKYYKADAAKDIYGKPTGGFCFGKATVKEISQFTEPADTSGVRVSQVNYTYQVGDFPAWAKLPETLSAIPQLKADVESEKTPIKSAAMLQLTNNGWVNMMPHF